MILIKLWIIYMLFDDPYHVFACNFDGHVVRSGMNYADKTNGSYRGRVCEK